MRIAARNWRQAVAVLLACMPLPAQNLPGQNVPGKVNTVEQPHIMVPVRPYVAPTVAPINLRNSGRLYDLIRAGNLYLTIQDTLALAIENNLNLEIDRYGPLVANSALERARAGGPLRGVPNSVQQVTAVDSGLGVAGTVASAGLSSGNNGGGGSSNNGGASIAQVGAVVPNLDPVLQNSTSFSHLSTPLTNTVASATTSLVDSQRTYSTVLTQGLMTGGTAAFTNYERWLDENSPGNYPAVGPHMDFQIRQNLLQGFGVGLNNRVIRIGLINTTAAREVFRSQLVDLCVSVMNIYWDYATARDEVKLRQHALDVTQKFYDDTKREVEIGAMPVVELPRAEAELANRRQDVVIAQGNARQQAILLKEAISHTEDPLLESAEIIPLDVVQVPPEETLPGLHDMVTAAMAKRPDVAVERFREQTDAINLAGTTNPLLPTLQVSALTYNRGGAGSPVKGGNPEFVGGYGTALGQIFRRDFPNESATVQFQIPFGNHVAQGDYGIDQLQYRQSQLSDQRDSNRIQVDISRAAASLQQARNQYNAAKRTRELQEQLLAAEQKKSSGPTTFTLIMVDQRALIAAELSEAASATTYVHARVALDQVLGDTLEKYNITLEEGLNGRVDRRSQPPEVTPPPPNQQVQHK